MDFQEQRAMLESSLQHLKVDDLKAIARDIKIMGIGSIRLTGLKSEFVDRISDLLEICERKEKWDTVEVILKLMNARTALYRNYNLPTWVLRNHRVHNIRLSPQPRSDLGANNPPPSSRLTKEVNYSKSPFYDIVERLSGPLDFTAPPKSFPQQKILQFTLSQKHFDLLKSPLAPDQRHIYQVRFFCASHDGRRSGNHSGFQVEFPPVSDIKVNERHTIMCERLRGRKTRPGVVSPPDLMCNPPNLLSRNQVRINYLNKSDSSKHYVATIELVKRKTTEELVAELKTNHSVSKEEVLKAYNEKTSEDDVVMESTSISTKCPLSFSRIVTPCRSVKCRHLQCFDATSFLLMNEQIPAWWECPICNCRIDSLNDLLIDEYFADVLSKVSDHIEKVNITPNGQLYDISKDDGNEITKKERVMKRSNSEENNIRSVDDAFMILDEDEHDGDEGALSHVPKSQDKRQRISSPQHISNPARNAQVIDLTLSSDEEDNTPPTTSQNADAQQQTTTKLIPTRTGATGNSIQFTSAPIAFSTSSKNSGPIPLYLPSLPSTTASIPLYLPLMSFSSTPGSTNVPISQAEFDSIPAKNSLPALVYKPISPKTVDQATNQHSPTSFTPLTALQETRLDPPATLPDPLSNSVLTTELPRTPELASFPEPAPVQESSPAHELTPARELAPAEESTSAQEPAEFAAEQGFAQEPIDSAPETTYAPETVPTFKSAMATHAPELTSFLGSTIVSKPTSVQEPTPIPEPVVVAATDTAPTAGSESVPQQMQLSEAPRWGAQEVIESTTEQGLPATHPAIFSSKPIDQELPDNGNQGRPTPTLAENEKDSDSHT